MKSGKANAYLSQKLVTIVRDVPFQFKLEDLRVKGIKREELRSLLRELNFKSFEKNLLGDGTENINTAGEVLPPTSVQKQMSDTTPLLADSSSGHVQPVYQTSPFEFNELPVLEVLVSEIEDRIRYGQSVWVTVLPVLSR